MKLLFHAYLGMILSFTLVSCSKPESSIKTQWRQGDDVRSLSYLNQITTPVPETITVLDENIEFSPQTYGGLQIENTFVKKINSVDGAILAVDSVHREDFKNLKKINTSSVKAVAKTKNNILKNYPFLEPEDLKNLKPTIDESNRVVWNLSYFDKSGQPYLMKLDKNLKLISRNPVGANLFSASAVVFPSGPKFSTLKEVTLKDLSFSPPLSNPLFTITSAITEKFDESQTLLQFAPEDPRFDQVQVYYYVAQAMDWIKNTLKIDLKSPLDIQVHVGFPEKTNAAFYYQGKIRLGAGDDAVYSRMPQDPTIVSHEVFHSLIESVSRLPFEGEGGSLNEAFADFFTSQLLKKAPLGDSSFLQGPFKRSVDNSKKWTDKSGALYGDSLIISGLLWELSQKIGEDKILKVALRTLARLNPTSQFTDFNRECRAALKEFLDEDEFTQAQNILAQRGFPL